MNAVLTSTEPPSAGLSRIRFQLLGHPIVAWNGSILTISRRTVRALLFRLACEPKPVAREHLHLLFWADMPEAAARRNLSHCLTHLRRALPVPQALAASPERIWLDPEWFWSDTIELNLAASDPALPPTKLPQLIELYRGPFLADFDLPGCAEFEHWCLVERSNLERQYLKLLERLVGRCTNQGEIRQAIHYARLYLATDGLSEAMHQRLIQLYAASGERHLALQQFEQCAATLAGELSVEPLPETRAVYLAVLKGQLRFPEPAGPPHTPSLREAEAPLIGREKELSVLEAAFARLESGDSQVVLLSGEAGIGKTRLMREFARRHANQARLLYGSSHAGEQAISYRPILEIVRAILSLPDAAAEGQTSPDRPLPDFVDPIWLTELSRLLPELRLRYPDLPPPMLVEPESAQTRLFDALGRLILSYARYNGPVLICLDDLQWMDPASKAWLAHTGRYLKRGDYPLLVAGTYRTEEEGAIQDLRKNLVEARILTEIQLSRLDAESVRVLLRALIGVQAGDDTLASQLHQATGGNPFYLIETLHKLIEEGRLGTDIQPLELPESVREAIQARLRLVSPIAYQVLEAGSVLGSSFNGDLLRLTAGRSHSETLAALQELAGRVLLIEHQQEYRFIHELTRQHVYENLGQIRQRLLHLRAARALLRLAPENYLILAAHFEQGGDLARALEYQALATRRAQSLFAWQEVELHQGRMLDLLACLDPSGEQPELGTQRGAILSERAHTRYLLGHKAGRDADLQALSALGETSQDDRIRLQAILSRLRYLNLDGEYSWGIALAEKGLALLASSPSLSQDGEAARLAKSNLLAQSGFGYYFLGRPAEALGQLEQARALCSGESEPEACGRISHILGYVYLHLGDYSRSMECHQCALTCHQELGDADRQARDLVDLGILQMSLANLDQAQQYLSQGLVLARQVASRLTEAYGLAHSGKLKLYQGNYVEAAGYFQRAVDLQQTTPSEHVLATAEAGMGFACFHLGDYTMSRTWLERALQRARTSSNRRRTAKTLIQLGMLDTVEGSYAAARWNLIEGLSVAKDCQSDDCLAAGLAALARLERLAGDPECALDLALEAVRSSQQTGQFCCEMWGELEAGLDYLALQELTAAREHARRAVDLAPKACQDWIHRDEAQRAYELVLNQVQGQQAKSLN